jgi:hypothetical protein
MSVRDAISYSSPAHYVFWEAGAGWYAFGPMPLFEAILLAVGKYRTNHEACVLSEAVSLVGIDAILAVRRRADFPVTLSDQPPLAL